MTPSPAQPTSERLTGAAVRLWDGDDQPVSPVLPAHLASVPGLATVGDVLVVLPAAGDPAVFDTALEVARQLLRESPAGRLRALIHPAVVEVADQAVRLEVDPLAEDLELRPPRLPRGAVLLTSAAANALERARRTFARHEYAGPSGRRVPLLRAALDRARPGGQPRNVTMFGRRPTRFTDRPGLIQELEAAWAAPALRVSGELGSGKTRLVAELLTRRGETAVWVDLGSSRSALRPSLAGQILAQGGTLAGPLAQRSWTEDRHEWRQLLARRANPRAFAERLALATWAWLRRHGGPIRLVIDGMEGATAAERATLTRLGELPQTGRSLRLLLVGRNGGWEDGWRSTPVVAVGALREAEFDVMAAQLTASIALPREIVARLTEAAAGNPFVLEEAVFALLHRGSLRQVYGSFFYGGGGSEGFTPTARLVRQVRAEAERLRALAPLRLLAAAGQPLPGDELGDTATGWQAAALTAGWLRETATPWGQGVEWRRPFVARCLLEPLPPEEPARLRRVVGERLAAAGGHSDQAWELYRLLAGSPLARPALVAAAQSRSAERPTRAMIDALVEELRILRAAGGSEAEEFELLWILLPLAHRAELVAEVRGELARAIALARAQPDKLVALTALRAELEERDGRFDRAGASLRLALETAVAKETNADRKALLSIRLGRILMREERFSESRQLFERILPFVEETGRAHLASSCRFYLGNIALAEHRTEEAAAHHQAALEARRKKSKGSDKGLIASLSALGAVATAAGNYPAALVHYREAQALLSADGRGVDLAYVLLGMGRALGRLGDFQSAAAQLRRVVALREGSGDVHGEAIARLQLGEALLQMDQVAAALREARQGHFLLSMATESRHLADADLLLGRVLLRQNQLEEAGRHFAAARHLHRARRDGAAAAWDRGWQLALALQAEREDEVSELGGELDRYLEEQPYPELGEVIDLHLFRALEYVHRQDGDLEDALRYLRRGYRNLLRKTAHLEPGSRHAFLFQVPQNRDLLAAATRHGLSLPPPD